jgi:hypothetical protein
MREWVRLMTSKARLRGLNMAFDECGRRMLQDRRRRQLNGVKRAQATLALRRLYKEPEAKLSPKLKGRKAKYD